MNVTLIILFSLVSLLFIVHLIFLIIYKEKVVTTAWFIAFCTFFVLTTCLWFLDLVVRIKGNLADFRTVVTLMTVVIATVSFFTTILLSNKTSRINKENQKSNILMGVMKNHYDLMNEKQKEINALIASLKVEFVNNKYVFDKLIRAFDSEFRGRTTMLEKEFRKAKDYFDRNPNALPNKDKGKASTLFESFDNLSETRKFDIKRILSSYFEVRSSYPYFYEPLKEEVNGKPVVKEEQVLFPEVIKIYLNDHTHFFTIVDDFISRHKDIIDSKISYNEISDVCREIFNERYAEIGHFFRNSYRVVKMINLYYKDEVDLRKNYLGILRSQYSENIILAIYYNCIFTDKGVGYANQLVQSDFFGDEKDLEDDNPIHFRTNQLIFGDKDLKTIKKIFTSEAKIMKKRKKWFLDKDYFVIETEDHFKKLKEKIEKCFSNS